MHTGDLVKRLITCGSLYNDVQRLSSVLFVFCSQFSATVLQMKFSPGRQCFFCDWCLLFSFFPQRHKENPGSTVIFRERVGEERAAASLESRGRERLEQMERDLVGTVAAVAERGSEGKNGGQ